MKFGVREIVDVVFKAADNMTIGTKSFKKYQPVFMIDTATTSSLEQSTTTVYAQGGKGYNRLIAWEGEKTMTFTVTDALMSPMGLAVLTGAGLIKHKKGIDKQAHVHTTINVAVKAGEATISVDDLNEDYGLDKDDYVLCNTVDMYATQLDGSGAGIEWYDARIKGADPKTVEYIHINKTKKEGGADPTPSVTFEVGTKDADGNFTKVTQDMTVQLDFYVIFNNNLTEVNIEPGSFGGYFYVEAQTLFRREDTGKDMAAEIILPKVKVQSAFTFTMAASGDPSTFDFVMDALPGYTQFDHTKKQMCVMQIIGEDKPSDDSEKPHTHNDETDYYSPSEVNDPEPEPPTPVDPTFETEVAVVPSDAPTLDADMQANQSIASVVKTTVDKADTINVTIAGGTSELVDVTPKAGWPASKWVALDYNTGEDTIEGISYTNRGTTVELGQEDIDDATALGLPAGHMVVWVRADGVLPATFTLTKGEKTVDVTINME